MTSAKSIDATTILHRAADALAAPVDNDLVLLHIPNGTFYGFDDISRRVWELLETPCSLGQVCDQLMQEFEVDRETCERDTLELAGTLIEAGLLEDAAA
ncbi:MAG: PqqD family protein [Planctomycetaceae bacterium]|nr:PqqD family protein [Planctomycetaceae bacterium]